MTDALPAWITGLPRYRTADVYGLAPDPAGEWVKHADVPKARLNPPLLVHTANRSANVVCYTVGQLMEAITSALQHWESIEVTAVKFMKEGEGVTSV